MEQAVSRQQIIEMVRRTATRKGRERSGFFSIEGIRLHERAMRAGVKIEAAITTATFMSDPDERVQDLFVGLKQQGCQIETVPDTTIIEITGARDLGQILGVIQLPKQRPLSDLTGTKKRVLLLVAVDVKDPGNVGAMLRTAHASGADAFVATGISDPYHPKALRTTMGSPFRLPVYYFQEGTKLIDQLRDLGIHSIGAVAKGGTPLPYADFSESGVAVFVGSEAWGLAPAITAALDQLVTIPMGADVDSFSVNAAAAVILYDISCKWASLPESDA